MTALKNKRPARGDVGVSEYDAVVVGAGPIGGYLAAGLAEGGVSVLLLEEHSEIGRPFQCAGLVNPHVMNLTGLHHQSGALGYTALRGLQL